ncbi:hypothetical protein [Bacillus tuaregi]|uniref:hypothetical protein n=1 Tax=Bacillus tuaregi TaxID=1816695 RepID=UPI001113AF6F|nr:hypothetical protein [Bacillus tuaregi]
MYYYQPNYYYHPYYYPVYVSYRQSLPVDPTILYQSANQTKTLMKEGSMVLNKLADSKEFDKKLMSAAQISDTEEVKRLIQSIGITSDIDINFNPDGLRLEFKSKAEHTECCRLLISLRWN